MEISSCLKSSLHGMIIFIMGKQRTISTRNKHTRPMMEGWPAKIWVGPVTLCSRSHCHSNLSRHPCITTEGQLGETCVLWPHGPIHNAWNGEPAPAPQNRSCCCGVSAGWVRFPTPLLWPSLHTRSESHIETSHNPLVGHNPLFGKHCFRGCFCWCAKKYWLTEPAK